MTAITLESDSSHSPPVLTKSNGRSSNKGLKSRRICGRAADFCENSRRAWRTIPRSFRKVIHHRNAKRWPETFQLDR